MSNQDVKPKKSRGYCFTLNNYTDDECKQLKDLECTYLVYGHETGENGTPHLQGYVYFPNPRTIKGIKTIQGFARAHLEVQRGTAEQAVKYCKKEGGEIFEKGEMPQAGKRKDIDAVKQLVKDGAGLEEIWEKASSFQAYKMGEIGLRFRQAKARPNLEVYWYFGPTGCGKSYQAQQEAGADAYYLSESLQWWDGYIGQKHVVIDDFRAHWGKFSYLLQILGKMPLRVQYKGGSQPLQAVKIWVTCAMGPEAVYKSTVGDVKQLVRRCTKIAEFSSRDNPVYDEIMENTRRYMADKGQEEKDEYELRPPMNTNED